MKRSAIFFTIAIFLMLLFQGCAFLKPTYDITVNNYLDYDLSIYLDGVFQFELESGGNDVITDVEKGTHTLEAKFLGEVVADRTVNINSNLEWTVY